MIKTMQLKKLCALLGFVIISLSSFADDIATGMPREQVLALLGTPTGTTKYGKTEVLYFFRGRVQLEDGKVITCNLVTEEQARERDFVKEADRLVMGKFRPNEKYAILQVVPEAGAFCSMIDADQLFFLIEPSGTSRLLGDGARYSDSLYWAGNYTYSTPQKQFQTIDSYCVNKATAIECVRKNYNLYDHDQVALSNNVATTRAAIKGLRPRHVTRCGSGFFITKNGYILTNAHVVKGADGLQIQTADKLLEARLVAQDFENDIALLKVSGEHAFARFSSKLTAKLGQTVFTIGFPMPEIQGFSPKITKGVVSSLKGAQDDLRTYQIDAAVQPGNSGGPLADEAGNVIGMVAFKLNDADLIETKATIVQNVNYAIKMSYILAFLEKHADVLKEIKKEDDLTISFEDAVEKVQKATVLVWTSNESMKRRVRPN